MRKSCVQPLTEDEMSAGLTGAVKHQARTTFVAHLSLCPICSVNIKLGDTAHKLYMDISPPTNTLIKVLEISGAFAYSSLQDQPSKE